MLEIYELVSGEIMINECAFNRNACPFARCVFEVKMNELKIEFKNYLKEKTFDEYAEH
ncbi:MAG: hypothetical protein U5Q03_02745 [Bacteroidota bacterium]|nr:hypothetical protein [Bacteroidota bacterium]